MTHEKEPNLSENKSSLKDYLAFKVSVANLENTINSRYFYDTASPVRQECKRSTTPTDTKSA